MDMLHNLIKENHECSYMVANILRADPHTPDPENGVSRSKIVNEYDQEIPQSQTADNPVAP